MFITVKGNDYVINTFYWYFIVPFFRIYFWRHFTMSSFSTGLLRWREYMLLHAFIHLNVCSFLIFVWCLTNWLWPMNVTLVKFRILQEFVTCKDYFIQSMFDVWPYGHYPKLLCICQYVLCMCEFQTRNCCICLFQLFKNYSCWFIHDMIIPNEYVSSADVLHGFGT